MHGGEAPYSPAMTGAPCAFLQRLKLTGNAVLDIPGEDEEMEGEVEREVYRANADVSVVLGRGFTSQS